ncbi:MAG: LamG domain-containing protein [Myxococcaceae bacterium]|nr:LamG domain-containing protein [Myxococcaceae bacterium]
MLPTSCRAPLVAAVLLLVSACQCGAPTPAPLPPDVVDAGTEVTFGDSLADVDAIGAAWRPQFEADYNTLQPAPGVQPATPSQTADVVVRPGSLLFDPATHPEVLSWQPGQVVVSAPSSDGGTGRNPFGFARKVVKVEATDAGLEVTTELPALEEIVSGDLQQQLDPAALVPVDLAQVDLDWAAENLYRDDDVVSPDIEGLPDDSAFPDVDDEGDPLPDAGPSDPFLKKLFKKAKQAVKNVGQAIAKGVTQGVKAVVQTAVNAWKAVTPDSFQAAITLNREITIPTNVPMLGYSYTQPLVPTSKVPMELTLSGSGSYAGSLTFNPRTQVGMRVPNLGSSTKFKVWLNVDSYLRTTTTMSVDFSVTLASAGGAAGSALEASLNANADLAQSVYSGLKEVTLGHPDTKPAGGWKKTLFISKPATQTVFAGPVPVVFTQTFQLDLECGFEARASLKTTINATSALTMKFRAEYEKGGTSGATTPQFTRATSQSIAVTGGGSVALSCGLIPRINAFVYDAVGINAGVRGSLVARASYDSTCEPDPRLSRPKGLVTVGLYGNIGVQFGGRLQAPGSSFAGTAGQQAGFDVGPLEPWNMEFPIYQHRWDVPGLGYCTPTCRNRSTSMSEQETDVDCGGACASACAVGKRCRVTSDCAGGSFCTGGVCSTTHCGNGVRDGDETAIDCGGARCPARCALQRECRSGADCRSGFCRLTQGSGSNLGRCVADRCQDRVRNGGELGVDCGGGGCMPCPVGTAVTSAAGCASGASNGTVCVATSCRDLVRNGAETDVDCGGPSCPACVTGRRCSTSGDCGSGVCNAGTCAQGPVPFGRWEFDSSPADSSGNGRTASFTPDAGLYEFTGFAGTSALDVAGGAAVVPAFDVGDRFTLMAWVRPPFLESSRRQVLLATSAGAQASAGFALGVDQTSMDGRLWFQVGDGAMGCERVTAPAAFLAGTWVHVAATVRRSAGEVQLFVNGAPVAVTSAACPVINFPTNRAFSMGAAAGGGQGFGGQLDRVALFNGVLPAADVAYEANPNVCLRTPCLFSGGTSTGAVGGKVGADRLCAQSPNRARGLTSAVAFMAFGPSTPVTALAMLPGFDAGAPLYGPSGLKVAQDFRTLFDGGAACNDCELPVRTRLPDHWFHAGPDGVARPQTCNGGTSASASDEGIVNITEGSGFGSTDNTVSCNESRAVLCLGF